MWEATAKRLGVTGNDAVAYVLKTFNSSHAGKDVGDARAHRPDRRRHDALVAGAARQGGCPAPSSSWDRRAKKRGPAAAGETVALGKLEHATTGDTLSSGKQAHPALAEVKPYAPVLAISVSAKRAQGTTSSSARRCTS